MKATVSSKVSIAAKPAAVFKYLEDPQLHYLWNPPLRSVSAKGKLKAGASYSTTSMMLGITVDNANKVTKFEKNRLIEIQGHGGTLEFCAEYSLESQSEITVVICKTSVAAAGKAFAFAKPVLKLLAQRELQSDLQALKLAVEHKLG